MNVLMSLPRRRPGVAFSAAVAAACLTACLPTPASAYDLNGFTPGAGRGDFAISYTAEGYDEFWVGETEVSDPGVGDVEITSYTAWFRWGFTDDFSIIVNLPYVDADSDGLGGFGESELQDLTALVAYRFVGGDGPHTLLGAAGVRTPASGYEENLPVDVGDGSTDALVRLVYQYTGPAFYISQQVGFDSRGDDVPDGFPLFTELGFFAGRATISGFYQVYIADDGTDIGDPGFTFPSNQEEFERAGAKVFARFNDTIGASFMGFTTLDGRNTGKTSGFSAGLNFSF